MKVTKMDYPKDLLQIQVLDDSTDETHPFAESLVNRYRALGFPIEYHHRTNRHGYKAGALQEGLENGHGRVHRDLRCGLRASTGFCDADDPSPLRTRESAWFQTRWSYLNRSYNFLTEVEAMMLDGHFILEHGARSRAGLFFQLQRNSRNYAPDDD